MVEAMKPGAVIVMDLAAESGGNCELTRPGQTIEHNDDHPRSAERAGA